MRTATKLLIIGVVLIVFGLALSTQLTVFVVQPIGALPEGRTIVMTRLAATEFIDSPDAMCLRVQGSVNLLCRGLVLAQVGKNGTILLRLPYSHMLYLLSTGGKTFDR